jgi:predicted TIM-barrel fold metal-dependent hydrolase
MAMPINGYGWHKTGRPTAEVFRARQERYYLAAIDAFGPSRSMFESNFPVDRQSIDYRTLWNAMKAIAAPYSEGEREEMFYGTAQRFYRIAEANADANTPARR